MNTSELVTMLEARGAILEVIGERLRIQPRESVPLDLVEEIRARKPEIVGLLRSRISVGAPLASHAKPDGWPLTTEDILAMPLSEFATTECLVTVHSQVLGETVVLASDHATVDPGERRVVYRTAELWSLHGLEPAIVRSMHDMKRAFGGTIEPS